MKRTYDPDNDSWNPLSAGDYVLYNMKYDIYNVGGSIYEAETFRRNESHLRAQYEAKD